MKKSIEFEFSQNEIVNLFESDARSSKKTRFTLMTFNNDVTGVQ